MTPLRFCVALVVVLRVGLGAVGWAVVQGSPEPVVRGEWPEALFPTGSAMAALVHPWNRWDSLWYEHIATSGYRPGGDEAAFFPAGPALLAAAGRLLGGQYAVAALALSTLLAVLGLCLLYQLVVRDLGDDTARRAVASLALAPVAFYLLAPYSEALFLCLSVGAFLGARRRQWALAGACALLAGLTRPAGVLLALPLAVEAALELMERRRAGRRPLRPGHIAVLAPVAGLAAWELYVRLALHIPDGIAGAARHWGQHPAWPWQSIADAFRVAVAGAPEEWLNLAAVLGVAVAIVLAWRRLPRSYAVYAAAMLVPMTFREAAVTPLSSDARYALTVFPLFVVLAVVARRRWAQVAIMAVSIPLLVLLFVLYAAYDFIG